MKKLWKLVSVLMAAIMLLSAVPFAASAEGNFDTSEHVILNYYIVGGEGGVHADELVKAVNDYLTEKINAELNPIVVSWGDYRTKLPLIWSSGEAYDLTFTADWAGYYTEAPKGAFLDITDLAPIYAPVAYSDMKERGHLDAVSVNGRLYMINEYLPDFTTHILNYRMDLCDKYGIPYVTDDASLWKYMETIRDNEPAMQPYGIAGSDTMPFWTFLNTMDWSRPLEGNNGGFFVYSLKDPTCKVFNVVETPEYAEWLKQMRSYVEAGFIPSDVMASTVGNRDAFQAGNYATGLINFSGSNGCAKELKIEHPDWKIGYYSPDLNSGMTEFTAPGNGGIAVGRYSKHPERALMFLELMKTDQTMFNLIMSGIEGVNYEWDPETMTKWPKEGIDPAEWGGKNLGMGLNEIKFALNALDDDPDVSHLRYDLFTPVGVVPTLSGFSFNSEDVAAEVAALKGAQDEYKNSLEHGVLDVDSGLASLKDAMNRAGAEDVLEEMNRQVQEWLATK